MSVYTLGSAYNKFGYCVLCLFIHWVPLTTNSFIAWYVSLYTGFRYQRICLLHAMSVYTLGSAYNEFVYCVICQFIHWVPLTTNSFTAWYVCLYTGFRLQQIRLLCDMSVYTLGSAYNKFVYCVICQFIHWVPLTNNSFIACYVCLYTGFHLQRIRLLCDMSVYTLGSAYNEFVYCVLCLFIHWVPLTMNSFIAWYVSLYTGFRIMNLFTAWYVCLYTGFRLQQIRLLRDMSVYTLGSVYNKFVYCMICQFIHWVPLKNNSFIACYVCLYTGFRLQRIRLLRDMSVYTLGSAYNEFVYCVLSLFIHWVPLTMNSFIAWYVSLYTGFRIMNLFTAWCLFIHWVPLTTNSFIACYVCLYTGFRIMNLVTACYVCLYTGFRLQQIRLLRAMSVYTLGSVYNEFLFCVLCLFIHWVPLTTNLFIAWYVSLYTGFRLQQIRLLRDTSVYTPNSAYKKFIYYVILLFINSWALSAVF